MNENIIEIKHLTKKFGNHEVLKDINWYKEKEMKNLKEVCLLSGDNCLYFVKKNKVKLAYKIYSSI